MPKLKLILCLSSVLVLVGTSGLLNHGEVSKQPTDGLNPNHLWEEMYKLKTTLEVIQKENEELKKNQSVLSLEVEELKKGQIDLCFKSQHSKDENNDTLTVSSIDIATLSSVMSKIGELERNHASHINLFETLNASIDSVKSLQRSTAVMATSLRRNLSNAENKIASLQRKIVFSAKLPATIADTVKNGVLQYNQIITNIGGSYNPVDCVFTAPLDGYYIFSWSTSQVDRKYTYSVITKNGAEMLYEGAYTYYIQHAVDSTSQTVSMQLQAGDRVWIKLKAGNNPHVQTTQIDFFESVFTGFKL